MKNDPAPKLVAFVLRNRKALATALYLLAHALDNLADAPAPKQRPRRLPAKPKALNS